MIDVLQIAVSDSDSDDAALQMALKISREEVVQEKQSLAINIDDEPKYVPVFDLFFF